MFRGSCWHRVRGFCRKPVQARVVLTVFAVGRIFHIRQYDRPTPILARARRPCRRGDVRIGPCRRIPFQPFRLFDLVDFVAFDHVGTSGHVDHGLVESAVCVEFVHSNVVSVEFAESFGLVGVEVEVVYVQRVVVDGGRDQMLHAKPAAGLAHGDVERGGEDRIVFAWLIPGFDALHVLIPEGVDQFFEFQRFGKFA